MYYPYLDYPYFMPTFGYQLLENQKFIIPEMSFYHPEMVKFQHQDAAEMPLKHEYCSAQNLNYVSNVKLEGSEEYSSDNQELKQESKGSDEKDRRTISERISEEEEGDGVERYKFVMKNTESNIVNQIFSHLCSQQKITPFLNRIYENDPKKVKSFCQIMSSLKKNKKKYVRITYLTKICKIKPNQIGYKMMDRAVNKMKVLTVPDFQKAVALLILNYLRSDGEVTILTSKKILKTTVSQHLRRKREIKRVLIETFKHQL